MFKSIRGRIVTIIVVALMAGWQLWANYDRTGSPMKLGLDLQGGMHLVLEVDDPEGTMTAQARAMAIDQAERVIRSRIDELGVEEPLIQQVGDERLIVELAGITDQDQARSVVQQAAFLQFKLVMPLSDVEPALTRLDRAVVASLGVDSIRALGRAVEAATAEGGDIEQLLFGGEAGDTTPGADTTGADTAAADTGAAAPDTTGAPGGEADQPSDGTELRPFTSLLNQGDTEGVYLVATEDVPVAELFLGMDAFRRAMPRDLQFHFGEDVVGRGARTYKRLYLLTEEPFMTGSALEDAVAGRDPQFNQAQVNFTLSRAGGRQFSRFTSQHVGDFLAILLDQEVISAPVIRDRIGSRGQIDLAGAPMEEARDLALVLRAGALPAPLQIMEERTVGPSLGQDSIDQGEVAGIIGLILVLILMIGYYRVAGALAVAALIVYVVLVMGGLAGLGATLTLPGIAGLILSVGMAVDANVLIFERIREELAAGRATRTAVDEGFEHALSAIVDANITTLITALILLQFGTGPVKGFAVTLSIGIVASFFSALYVTRTFFLVYLQGKKASDPISI
ncbi:MAG: protein translocase subunit SecD [Gemmatimonadota bacterium]|jgi:preprotein translocase subunit SecD